MPAPTSAQPSWSASAYALVETEPVNENETIVKKSVLSSEDNGLRVGAFDTHGGGQGERFRRPVYKTFRMLVIRRGDDIRAHARRPESGLGHLPRAECETSKRFRARCKTWALRRMNTSCRWRDARALGASVGIDSVSGFDLLRRSRHNNLDHLDWSCR